MVKSLAPTLNEEPKEKKVKMDSIDCPNHLVPRANPCFGPGPNGVCTWPMVQLMQEGTSGKLVGAFIDSMHGADGWYEWMDHPPTWMDPEVFAAMAQQDPEIQKILRVSWQKKTRKYEKLLPKHLQRVFEEKYVPYMLKRFEYAKQLIGHYLVSRYSDGEIQKEVDEENARIDKEIGQ